MFEGAKDKGDTKVVGTRMGVGSVVQRLRLNRVLLLINQVSWLTKVVTTDLYAPTRELEGTIWR